MSADPNGERGQVTERGRPTLRTWLNSDEADALREELAGVRYERDLFAEYLRDPAHLLNHLMDARGVEVLPGHEWGSEGLPAAIRIPADLSRQVFGGLANGDVSQTECRHRWLVSSHLGHLLPEREASCLDCGMRFHEAQEGVRPTAERDS